MCLLLRQQPSGAVDEGAGRRSHQQHRSQQQHCCAAEHRAANCDQVDALPLLQARTPRLQELQVPVVKVVDEQLPRCC